MYVKLYARQPSNTFALKDSWSKLTQNRKRLELFHVKITRIIFKLFVGSAQKQTV